METTSIRLGKIAGIPVGVSWTLLIIAGVFALGLAEGQYPNSNPGYSVGTYWIAASVTVAVFFASILVHELAHAVVAKRNGLPVEGITLWLLGGVARLGGEAKSPAAELRIAGVGPVTSALLAVLFWGLSSIASGIGADPLVVHVFAWLGLINAILAAFNALPAAPLDGGRVLAAIWWWRSGSRTKGLVGAAFAGRLLGGALIIFAVWELLYRDGVMGLWTVVIGWFIWQSAAAEGRSALARGALAGITAVEAARPDPPVVDQFLTVDGLIVLLGDGGDHTAFVVREHDGVLRSIVSLDDIRRVPPGRRSSVNLADIAVPIADLTTAWATESLLSILDRVPSEGRPEIVVYDDRMCLVGVISRADLARLIHQATSRPKAPTAPPPPPPRTDATSAG